MMRADLFPIGYTFSPSDQQLLSYYLYHKLVGKFKPPITLPLVDLYSHEPSAIWQQFGGIEGQDLHFFTQLKRKKSRIVRKVGSNGGTWSGESKPVEVFSSTDGTLIGTLKRFHYENPKANVSDGYSWIMYEYTIHPNLLPNGIAHDSYVVCKIRKRIQKKGRTAATTTQMEV